MKIYHGSTFIVERPSLEILKYLHDGYDMLHTQGDRWLIKDIDEFLKIRGYNVK